MGLKFRNTYQLGFDLLFAVLHQDQKGPAVFPMDMHVFVVLVENDLPIVFAHCTHGCYTVLVCGTHSTVVGSYYDHQKELPMLVLVVQVDAWHRPEDFKATQLVNFILYEK